MRASGVLSGPEEVNADAATRAADVRSGQRRGALSDTIAAIVIKACACLAIVSLILIFVFIGKEALPVLTSAEVRQEADLSKLFLPDATGYAWQPVSDPPRFSLIPLLVGTLKATLIAVLTAIPLAVAAALFT